MPAGITLKLSLGLMSWLAAPVIPSDTLFSGFGVNGRYQSLREQRNENACNSHKHS